MTSGNAKDEQVTADEKAFLAQREERAALVERFLMSMAPAGNPGSDRTFGSTVKEITGQHPLKHWTTTVSEGDGDDREFIVFEDGRHGWSDEMTHSDRPRSVENEPAPELVRRALGKILREHDLDW